MITYELAKELKEKGFPQKKRSIIMANEDNFLADPNKLDVWYYCPSLAELIEACGKQCPTKDFGEFYLLADDEKWETGYVDTTNWENSFFTIKKVIGSTPEEAVARLWLALQEK